MDPSPILSSAYPLNVAEWEYFRLDHLFEIKKGRRLTKANMRPGETAFIGAVDDNNGLTNRVSAVPAHPENTITVNYNGNGVAEAFYQPKPYRCSDDVHALYPRFEMDIWVGLFICAVVRQEKYRFSYGRKWHLERMRAALIRLPTKESQPDWALMRNFMRALPYSKAVARGTPSP